MQENLSHCVVACVVTVLAVVALLWRVAVIQHRMKIARMRETP
jgi:hypothetical protein